MTAFLIDIATIKKIGFVNKNVDDPIIATTLRRVQDTLILPILGTPFFKRLLQGITDDDLTADEVLLLNDYIAPCIIAGVDYRIVNALTYETRSKTVGTSRDEHINPVTIQENLMRTDDLKRDYETYRDSLIGYLKDNETLFDLYYNFVCSYENIAPDKGLVRNQIRFI
jgi:hypothetical protein